MYTIRNLDEAIETFGISQNDDFLYQQWGDVFESITNHKKIKKPVCKRIIQFFAYINMYDARRGVPPTFTTFIQLSILEILSETPAYNNKNEIEYLIDFFMTHRIKDLRIESLIKELYERQNAVRVTAFTKQDDEDSEKDLQLFNAIKTYYKGKLRQKKIDLIIKK